MAILIFIDGVMRRENNAPVPDAVRLYRCLSDRERVVLLGDDKAEIDRWMRQNNLSTKMDDIIDYNPTGATEYERKLRQVEHARSKGPVEYILTDDIELAKDLLEQGLTCYLFLHPKYFSHKFRPDRPTGVKAWGDIVGELDKQQRLYEEDSRL